MVYGSRPLGFLCVIYENKLLLLRHRRCFFRFPRHAMRPAYRRRMPPVLFASRSIRSLTGSGLFAAIVVL